MKRVAKQRGRKRWHDQMFVGTAAWAIPSRYKEAMPGAGSVLERYALRLNAVEINSSFYRHHQVKTYERWASSVPPDFRFSVKVPRALTHEGELTPDAAILDRFLDEARGLGAKLGVLLVQLPPKLVFERSAARRFFAALRKRIDVQVACEPRHPSWGSEVVEGLLAKWGVARVAADPAPFPGADQPGGSGGFTYVRLHGHPRKYYSDYDEKWLEALRKRLSLVRERSAPCWVIFDNTALGYALGNALAFADAVAKPL
jgi:uncharacterized protein YecE (DUF72 family)